MRVVRFDHAADFLQHAESWLLQEEAANGLLLGLAHQLRDGTFHYDPPAYLATVDGEDGVVGCAFRMPPHKLGCTIMPRQAARLIAEDIARVYDRLPAMVGPEPAVHTLAQTWADRHGLTMRGGMRQRIYRLDSLLPAPRHVVGALRRAEGWDLDLLAAWVDRFAVETGMPTRRPRETAALLVDTSSLFVWDDDGPKSMAGSGGFTPNGVRINYVYTPEAHRGKGYAAASVHALSRHHLTLGRSFCFLYADLANPISNRLYERIGYRAVCDVRDYEFDG